MQHEQNSSVVVRIQNDFQEHNVAITIDRICATLDRLGTSKKWGLKGKGIMDIVHVLRSATVYKISCL